MIRLIKSQEGIKKVPGTEGNTFLNEPRKITYNTIEGNQGFLISDDVHLMIELDNNILMFPCNDTEIDGIVFNTPEELKNYMFS